MKPNKAGSAAKKPAKTIQKNEKFNWFKLLLLLVPPVFTFIISVILMPMTDTLNVTVWHIALMIFGFAALPLTTFIFSKFGSGGYFFSKTVGILSVSLIVWTLSYIGIIRFNKLFIILTLLLVTGLCYGLKPLRNSFTAKIKEQGVIPNMLAEELIFSLIFVLMCFFKGMYPDINGQEKFMDYGYIMSMLRSDTLPANDMWLSGYHINYYYFGQYIYALIIKLIGIAPSFAYTLSMCTAIALPFGSAYTIGTMLVELASAHNFQAPKFAKYIGGVLTGCTTILFGNSHSFFFDENSVGNALPNFLREHGVKMDKTDGFFYPDSTRYIGHNPELKVIDPNNGAVISEGDYTIHEFPFYSYLVGDLHAHVISMMVVLLIAAVCIALIGKVRLADQGELSVGSFGFDIRKESIMRELKLLLQPEVIAIGILLGIATMTNYWDFLIYFIFSAMTLLVFNTVRSKYFSTIPSAIFFAIDLALILGIYMKFSEKVFLHVGIQLAVMALALLMTVVAPSALTRTSFAMNFFFVTANIVAMTFNSQFDMISNKIAKVKDTTALYQFLILWGVHLLICILFIVLTIIGKNYAATKRKNKITVEIFNTPSEGFSNPIVKFFGERNIADIFVCGMSVTGFIMLIAPEIIYVRDIYTGGYLRANTMFKFTFAGFIILSLCIGYIITRLYWYINKKGEYSFGIFGLAVVLTILLIIPGHYTYLSLKQRCSDNLSKDNFKTLDGTKYLETYNSEYVEGDSEGELMDISRCIDWFNRDVKGPHVICEAYGDSYTDYNIISSYTGMPTVFGWQVHEWLWRFHGIIDEEKDILVSDPDRDVFNLYITPRHEDIDKVYISSDLTEIKGVCDKYDIEYIILSPLERSKYGSYEDSAAMNGLLSGIADVAFESGDTCVYKVR